MALRGANEAQWGRLSSKFHIVHMVCVCVCQSKGNVKAVLLYLQRAEHTHTKTQRHIIDNLLNTGLLVFLMS